MHKIIIAVAFFLVTFFGLGLTRIEAQVTGCTGWECRFTTIDGNTYQTCSGTPAGCDDNVTSIIGQDILCPPGTYVCNRICCAIGTGTAPSCFLPGTEIETGEGETKKIEEIAVGDRIRSFADDQIQDSSVSQIYKSRRDYYFELTAEDYSVKVTAEHPFYVGRGEFREVKDLVVGERVYVEKSGRLTPKRVTSKTRVDERTDVYNLSVDNTQTYFANGFAVHNKLGNRVCNNPAVNCPAGTKKSNVLIGSQCLGSGQIAACGIGTAQTQGACCKTCSEPVVCGDWYRCPTRNNPNKLCRDCTGGESWCCGNNVSTYRCDPICAAPSTPALTSPANGASIASTTVSLLWNSVTFSAGCTGQYSVYVGTTNPPTTLYKTVSSSTTSTTYTGARGTTYYWGVKALNGSASSGMNVRSFTILNDQIAGRVFYDTANNCGGSRQRDRQIWDWTYQVNCLNK